MFENVWLLGADFANVWLNVWFSGKCMAQRMALWQTYAKGMPKCIMMAQKPHICKRMFFFWADLANVWLNNVYVYGFLFQPL